MAVAGAGEGSAGEEMVAAFPTRRYRPPTRWQRRRRRPGSRRPAMPRSAARLLLAKARCRRSGPQTASADHESNRLRACLLRRSARSELNSPLPSPLSKRTTRLMRATTSCSLFGSASSDGCCMSTMCLAARVVAMASLGPLTQALPCHRELPAGAAEHSGRRAGPQRSGREVAPSAPSKTRLDARGHPQLRDPQRDVRRWPPRASPQNWYGCQGLRPVRREVICTWQRRTCSGRRP